MFIGTPGIWELTVIFLIVLLLFGGKKLPSLARSIGSAIQEFKKGISLSDSSEIEPNSETREEESQKNESKSQAKKSKKKTG
ncbi:MAG: twin-arginine translocase TatA/TatE family subunit [Spirochaetia bacterium]|nr:twin-arginine translocase TatA/TatE family subunit [Spirochaetia bacterium]